MQKTSLHIGNNIKAYLISKGIAKASLARKMGRSPRSILSYEQRASLQFHLIVELCDALRHNFFADIAAQLPETYTVSTLPDKGKEERIAMLEREIEVLKAEKLILLEALKK